MWLWKKYLKFPTRNNTMRQIPTQNLIQLSIVLMFLPWKYQLKIEKLFLVRQSSWQMIVVFFWSRSLNRSFEYLFFPPPWPFSPQRNKTWAYKWGLQQQGDSAFEKWKYWTRNITSRSYIDVKIDCYNKTVCRPNPKKYLSTKLLY
jgi:hypothetical protein